MSGGAGYVIGTIIICAIGFACFLIGKRSNKASGGYVPPSPEVQKKIAERIKKHDELKESGEALHETSDSLIADINALLGIDTDTG